MEKPREIAVRVLRRYAEGADYLENLLEEGLSSASLAPPDRALVQELTYGLVRWQATLDWLIAQKTDGRPQKAALQILLRLGVYQIFWLDRIPAHAAVHETVEMAKQLGLKAQTGFINAILRNFLRQQTETEKQLRELKLRQPALGYSHPEWLVTRWQKRWGDEQAKRLLEWNNTPPPTYARLNTLKTTSEKLKAQWETEGVRFTPGGWDWTGDGLVFQLGSHPPLATLASFQQGLFYIQDPSTLLAVQALNPQRGQRVLDLCAAPGGKTTFIAQRMQNQGYILALDVVPKRLEFVRQNCSRLGVSCVETDLFRPSGSHLASLGSPPPPDGIGVSGESAGERKGNEVEGQPNAGHSADTQDATSGPVATSPPFDSTLVDAPCSNTGVMRRRVDLRWRIRPEEIERLRRSQLDLLEIAAGRVKQGGTLVYSTCSLEPEENEHVIKEFLVAHPHFRLAQERALLPFVEGVDGAYVASLQSSER